MAIQIAPRRVHGTALETLSDKRDTGLNKSTTWANHEQSLFGTNSTGPKALASTDMKVEALRGRRNFASEFIGVFFDEDENADAVIANLPGSVSWQPEQQDGSTGLSDGTIAIPVGSYRAVLVPITALSFQWGDNPSVRLRISGDVRFVRRSNVPYCEVWLVLQTQQGYGATLGHPSATACMGLKRLSALVNVHNLSNTTNASWVTLEVMDDLITPTYFFNPNHKTLSRDQAVDPRLCIATIWNDPDGEFQGSSLAASATDWLIGADGIAAVQFNYNVESLPIEVPPLRAGLV